MIIQHPEYFYGGPVKNCLYTYIPNTSNYGHSRKLRQIRLRRMPCSQSIMYTRTSAMRSMQNSRRIEMQLFKIWYPQTEQEAQGSRCGYSSSSGATGCSCAGAAPGTVDAGNLFSKYPLRMNADREVGDGHRAVRKACGSETCFALGACWAVGRVSWLLAGCGGL